jgi:hypothetical protein
MCGLHPLNLYGLLGEVDEGGGGRLFVPTVLLCPSWLGWCSLAVVRVLKVFEISETKSAASACNG